MTDFRAELQALIDAADSHVSPYRSHEDAWDAALDRARAALAQPEPEGEGPTYEQLYELADEYNGEPVASMQAALARWGRPAPPLADDGPAVPEGREPASVEQQATALQPVAASAEVE